MSLSMHYALNKRSQLANIRNSFQLEITIFSFYSYLIPNHDYTAL